MLKPAFALGLALLARPAAAAEIKVLTSGA